MHHVWQMVKCGPVEMRDCSLGFSRVRDNVRVSVRDRVGVRVSTFYFLSHEQPAKSRIPARPHFTMFEC